MYSILVQCFIAWLWNKFYVHYSCIFSFKYNMTIVYNNMQSFLIGVSTCIKCINLFYNQYTPVIGTYCSIIASTR